MKISRLKTAMAMALLGLMTTVNADERILEVWTCKAVEGKTLKDIHEVNSKWVKYMNATVEGGDIHSYVLRTIVGDTTTFMYADSYPSMASWVAAKADESDEMTTIDEMLSEVADCSANTLHGSEES